MTRLKAGGSGGKATCPKCGKKGAASRLKKHLAECTVVNKATEAIEQFKRWFSADGHWIYDGRDKALDAWIRRGIEGLPDAPPRAATALHDWLAGRPTQNPAAAEALREFRKGGPNADAAYEEYLEQQGDNLPPYPGQLEEAEGFADLARSSAAKAARPDASASDREDAEAERRRAEEAFEDLSAAYYERGDTKKAEEMARRAGEFNAATVDAGTRALFADTIDAYQRSWRDSHTRRTNARHILNAIRAHPALRSEIPADILAMAEKDASENGGGGVPRPAADSLATVAKLASNLGISAVSTPSGSWVLVGRVPAALAFERKDGLPLTDEDVAEIRHVGVIGGKNARFRTVSFESEEAALAAAVKATKGSS